jgi:hypothetical protein
MCPRRQQQRGQRKQQQQQQERQQRKGLLWGGSWTLLSWVWQVTSVGALPHAPLDFGVLLLLLLPLVQLVVRARPEQQQLLVIWQQQSWRAEGCGHAGVPL